MLIDTNHMFSMTEANQNFSRIARAADEFGSAVILKNNIPKYLVVEFERVESGDNYASIDEVRTRIKKILLENRDVMKALAE